MSRGGRGRRAAKTPGALIVLACAAVLTVALTGATKPLSGLEFGQDGHWVLNAAAGLVFHVDGASKYVDAAAPIPDADRGSQVVQGDTGGYVVGSSKITEFEKSSLTPGETKPLTERPVALEVTGGPYLVFRQAGTVTRLGKPPVTVPGDGKLGVPVVTREGSLWLHRIDRGALCELPKGADRVACPVAVPSGHSGALTVANDRPSFVDTTADALREITPGGLGDPVPLGVDLPSDVLIASTDVGGKIAALDQRGKRLYLMDKTGGKSFELDGNYAGIASSGSVVALVDKDKKALVTYGVDGIMREDRPIPGGEAPVPLIKGEDGRVYVDSAGGDHVLVVDADGAVSPVQATGVGKNPEPVPQPDPAKPDPVKPDPGPEPKPKDVRKPPVAPVAPASPPGAPGRVTATAGDGSATVKWSAANPNGAPITGYRVSWPGGTKTVGGGARSATITGLENGTSYVFTVEAINRAGTGTGAGSPAVTPRIVAKPPGKPGGLKIAIKTGDADAKVSWTAAAANGSPVTAYHVEWNRPDGQGAQSRDLPGGTRTTTITDVGIESPLKVTVTAENSNGVGPAATVTKSKGDEPDVKRSAVVSRGKDTTADKCDPPVCAFMHIVLKGFTPGKITITAMTSDQGTHGSKTFTVGPDGTLTVDDFSMGTPNRDVWVIADGVESNHYTWPPS
ncbi:fibronectin type III domain-containing protein [Amycolatopsis xylanica]|uniref:fibronectin type III domain-containing protein n=1 Tax=Amycolatopsis xylanica TaxID=589385 RepID=UPI0015A188BF|nr:fibronectin type III domain-containing protein [Amycolatopsis xylanica]